MQSLQEVIPSRKTPKNITHLASSWALHPAAQPRIYPSPKHSDLILQNKKIMQHKLQQLEKEKLRDKQMLQAKIADIHRQRQSLSQSKAVRQREFADTANKLLFQRAELKNIYRSQERLNDYKLRQAYQLETSLQKQRRLKEKSEQKRKAEILKQGLVRQITQNQSKKKARKRAETQAQRAYTQNSGGINNTLDENEHRKLMEKQRSKANLQCIQQQIKTKQQQHQLVRKSETNEERHRIKQRIQIELTQEVAEKQAIRNRRQRQRWTLQENRRLEQMRQETAKNQKLAEQAQFRKHHQDKQVVKCRRRTAITLKPDNGFLRS